MKPTKEGMRHMAMYIARFIRDGLEGLHARGATMTDDNMPEINRKIRKGAYQYLRLLTAGLSDEELDWYLTYKQPPEYREEDVFDEVDEMIEKMKKDLPNN